MKRVGILVMILLLCGCSGGISDEPKQTEITESQAVKLDINFGKTSGQNALNNKNHASNSGLCCYVEETDTLFFSEGGFIWQQTEGMLSRLAEENAVSLNFSEGTLYYIRAKKDMSVFSAGDLCALDPKSGETQVLYSEDVSRVSVGEKISFSTAEMRVISDDTVSIGERCFECGLNGEDVTEVKPDLPAEKEGYGYHNIYRTGELTYCIEENYGDYSNSLCVFDESGIISRTKIKDSYIMDYTIIGENVWCYTGELICYDKVPNTGAAYHDVSGAPPFFSLYACGERLLAASENKIYEITVNDNGTFTANALIEEVTP